MEWTLPACAAVALIVAEWWRLRSTLRRLDADLQLCWRMQHAMRQRWAQDLERADRPQPYRHFWTRRQIAQAMQEHCRLDGPP